MLDVAMLYPCSFALPLLLCLPGAEAATLTVSLDGAKPGGGPLTVLLFDRAEGFPKEARAAQRHVLPAGQSTLALDNLKPGRYAVMAYHDEDGNGELNRFLGMIPKEGWGLSNNPAVSGKPSFKDAAVTLPEAGASLTLKLNY
jgi:uncharacterized protein (DUF2141 family)